MGKLREREIFGSDCSLLIITIICMSTVLLISRWQESIYMGRIRQFLGEIWWRRGVFPVPT